MVRAAALIALLAFTSCGKTPESEYQKGYDSAATNAEISALKTEVEALKTDINDLKAKESSDAGLIEATGASLTEARKNHDALHETFNKDVDINNSRAKAQWSMIQTIDDRLSRYDGMHTTR